MDYQTQYQEYKALADAALNTYFADTTVSYHRLPSRSCPQYDKVVNLLEIFDGDIPVILYLEDTKQKLAAPRRLYTSGHPLFFKELERLLGAENVATK